MSEEFSAGVNILLQRMETHPEEFYVVQSKSAITRDPKWYSVMTSVMQVKFNESARGEASYLTEAEVDVLWEGYRKIRRKAFDDYVMDTVLNPEQKLSSSEPQAIQAQYGQQKLRVGTANNDIQQYSGYSNLQGLYDVDTNQYRNAAQAQAQHIAAHQEAIARSGQNLMNANPYQSSQGSHPQPMSESMLSRINKRFGFK
jgi:hypothetical protein